MIQSAPAIKIPHSEDTITIQLTVKEAIALGHHVHFAGDRHIETTAKRKIAQQLEQSLIRSTDSSQIDYFALQV
ncbi:hypothetical protein ACFFK0_18920 [Paenibacillus chartarius]|uniref:Uncharacterized protein n=1 Tax=Paenibacillus chartarius TaxID=747481 RepID=A0ABV6DPD5_9BACL